MKPEIREQLLTAQRLLEEDKPAEAKPILAELCALDDPHPLADINFATVSAREGDFITATKYYLRARSSLQNVNDEASKRLIEFVNEQLLNLCDDLTQQGDKFLREEDFDQAEKCFLATKEIGNFGANYNLALLYKKKGTYELAREKLKESLDIGGSMLACTDSAAKNLALELLADTHNLLGTLDMQGHGCPNEEPNPLRALQNFKSALTYIPGHPSAKANKHQLKSLINPESARFFKETAKPMKTTNGQVTFASFVFEYANNSNIESYRRENPGLTPSAAIDDLLHNYLAGTSKKISFPENAERSEPVRLSSLR